MSFPRSLPLLLAMALLAGACSESAGERAAAHLARARHYLEAGKVDKARIEFSNVLAIDRKNVAAHFQLGQVYEQQQEWRKAVGQYQAAIALQPDHVQARLHLGRLYQRGGAPAKALEMAQDVLRRQPGQVEALQLKAAVLLQQGRTDEAIEIANGLLQLHPGYADTVIMLAVHYNRSGKPARAIELLEEGVAANPANSTLKYLLARSLSAAGRLQEAVGLVRQLVETEPQRPDHLVWLASLHAQDGDLTEARQVLDRTAQRFSDDPAVPRMIAEFWLGRGERARAIASLEEALSRQPDWHELRLYLASLYEGEDQPERALRCYREVIEREPDGVAGLTARNRLAHLLYTRGELAGAEALVAEVLEANPRDNDALLLRGTMALARDDAVAAIADFRSLLKDQPHSARLLGLLATAHAVNHEPELARRALERAVDNNPTDVQSRVALAKLLLSQGELRRAGELADQALRLAPGHLGAMRTLARIRSAGSDWDALLKVGTRMQKADPEGADGYFFVGLAQRGRGDTDAAVASLERAVALAPEDDAVLTALVGALLELARPQEAEQRVRAFLERQPKNPTACNLLGEVLLYRKDPAAAAAAFRKAIALAPRLAVPYRNLGLALRAQGLEAQARKVFRQGLEAVRGDEAAEAMLRPWVAAAAE